MITDLGEFIQAVCDGRVRDVKPRVYYEGRVLHVDLMYRMDPDLEYVTINVSQAKEPQMPKDSRRHDIEELLAAKYNLETAHTQWWVTMTDWILSKTFLDDLVTLDVIGKTEGVTVPTDPGIQTGIVYWTKVDLRRWECLHCEEPVYEEESGYYHVATKSKGCVLNAKPGNQL